MQVILDTSFILSCIKYGIDFLTAGDFGKLLVPQQVLDELKKIAESKITRVQERENSSLALQIIAQNKSKIKSIKLGKKYADAGIKKYAEKHDNIGVATVDSELKKALKNKAQIVTIKGKKKITLA